MRIRKPPTRPSRVLFISAVVLLLLGLTLMHNQLAVYESLLPTKSASPTTSTTSASLRAHIDEPSMKALRQHMIQKKASVPSFEGDCVAIFLSYLRTQHPRMFPLLDTVPVTANNNLERLEFYGQELEDRDIYERFFNEHTQACHASFGADGLFESGAYQGVMWSNTYFFEKHFSLPSILVEASRDNWGALDAKARKHRPLSQVHHAALCPVGDESVCLDNAAGHTAMHKVKRDGTCSNSIPCFPFNDTLQYSFISLDIEGWEWEFLKFRRLKADLILVEVIQWMRQPETLITAVEFTAYLTNAGYYLYADLVGRRNVLFVHHSLVDDCFANQVIV